MRSFVECIWTFWNLINYDNILPLPACPCNAWSGSQDSFYDTGNVRTAAKVWLVAIDRVHITVLHSQWLLEQLPNTTDMPTHSASCAVLLCSDKEGVMQDNYSQALNKLSQSLLYVYNRLTVWRSMLMTALTQLDCLASRVFLARRSILFI